MKGRYFLKKWMSILGVVLLLICLEAWNIFHHIETYKKSTDNQAINIAESNFTLAKIQNVMVFNGETPYHVIQGLDHLGHQVFVWVPDNKKEGLVFLKKASDGLTKSQILNKMTRKFPYNKIFSVGLGVKNGEPVWAVNYLDKNNHYSVTYFDFYNGKDMTISIA